MATMVVPSLTSCMCSDGGVMRPRPSMNWAAVHVLPSAGQYTHLRHKRHDLIARVAVQTAGPARAEQDQDRVRVLLREVFLLVSNTVHKPHPRSCRRGCPPPRSSNTGAGRQVRATLPLGVLTARGVTSHRKGMALVKEHSLPMAGALLLCVLLLGAGAPKKAPKLIPGQSTLDRWLQPDRGDGAGGSADVLWPQEDFLPDDVALSSGA